MLGNNRPAGNPPQSYDSPDDSMRPSTKAPLLAAGATPDAAEGEGRHAPHLKIAAPAGTGSATC